MNDQPEGVPDDYPGRVVAFPDEVAHLLFAMYGIQSPHESMRDDFIIALSQLFDNLSSPVRLERCRFIDQNHSDCDMLLAYCADAETFSNWWRTPVVQQSWQELTTQTDEDTGYWREVLVTDKRRFNYAAGVEDQVASAAVLPLKPSNTFGYWGAYRDRLPASTEDEFLSDFANVPSIREHETKGRRLRVKIPDNLCLIREGQGWGNCGAEEKSVWDQHMADVVDEWVDFLGNEPHETGCLSVRKCQEVEVLEGLAQPRQCQIAFLLSLGHIEQAARTHSTHLAVHKSFIQMYQEPKFEPKMHVWVEVHILKQNDLFTEYVNCHNKTGLLPYFEVVDIDTD